jgi:hypothetical protein
MAKRKGVDEKLVQQAEESARERKIKREARKSTLGLKKDDTLDIEHVVDAHIAGEVTKEKDLAQSVAEMDEIIKHGDGFPKNPDRWGYRGKLTVASPGHIIDDPTYIPEYVETKSGYKRHIVNHRIINGQLHVLTTDSARKMRWCAMDFINRHKRRGFRFESYKELFKDTGMFEDAPGDMIKNGDVILMSISMDGWERMKAERDRLQSALEGAYGAELFAAGQAYGAPTFKEDSKRGVREYYT